MKKLTAGTACYDMSPPEGVRLAGYPHFPRNNTGIHDPLFATCLYLSDGKTEIVPPCGYMPYQLSGGSCLIQNFMEGVGFTGLQNSFTMKHGKITLLRLIEDTGSYHLLCCTGEGLASTKLHQGYFPALDIKPDGDINELVSHYSGQHFAICYGDVSDEIKVLGKILKTDVICIE